VLDPQSAEAKTHLAGALVYEFRVFRRKSRMADLARAETLIDEALAASAAKISYAHNVKGGLLRLKGQWQDAINEFEAALALNRNNTAALQDLGWSKLSIGAVDEVTPLAEKAVRIGPRDPRIGFLYMLIGTVHLLQAQPQEAIVWFEKARGHDFHRAATALRTCFRLRPGRRPGARCRRTRRGPPARR
jgi:tetratricopeptide (TPR) repeat protein